MASFEKGGSILLGKQTMCSPIQQPPFGQQKKAWTSLGLTPKKKKIVASHQIKMMLDLFHFYCQQNLNYQAASLSKIVSVFGTISS